MSSSTISSILLEAGKLNYIGMMMIRCFCFIFIPIGTIGHLMSIYVFTRPALRSNPCSVYFLAATILELLITCYILPIRMIQSGFVDTDPGAHSIVFCKFAWLCNNSLRGMSCWLIVLASVDRYLCSSASATKRSWSSKRVAKRVVPVVILIGLLAYIHVPIFHNIGIIPDTKKPFCYPAGPPGTYRVVLAYCQLIYFGFSPSLCMFIFGILTFRNIERSKRLLVIPLNHAENSVNQNQRKTNRHMLRMLFVQILVYSVTGLTFSVAMIVIGISASVSSNTYRVAQENLIIAVVGMLSTLGPCISFYLFTLSSSLFRRELKNLFCILKRRGDMTQTFQTQTSNVRQHRKTLGVVDC